MSDKEASQEDDYQQQKSYEEDVQQKEQEEKEIIYPTFQHITKQIDLLDLYAESHVTKQTKQQVLFDMSSTEKPQSSSLLDLKTLDINLQDTNNTNLLDIATSDSLEIMKFLQGRQIEINDEIEVISQGVFTSYKLYTIYSKSKFGDQKTEVQRRFSDFEFLQEQLLQMYPGYIIPVLPQKNFWASLNMEGEQYSQQRIKKLKKYLDSLLMNQKLRLSIHLKLFLFESSAKFSQIKGQFQQKSKFQDKIKTVAGRVFEISKGFISSLVSKNTNNKNQQKWISYFSRDNLQITQYCLKIKSLNDSISKIKTQIIIKAKQIDVLLQLCQNKFLSIKQTNANQKIQLLSLLQDTFSYVESCWQALTNYARLFQQLDSLKIQQQSMLKKYRSNPRAKQMDLLKTKIKKLSQKIDKSNSIFHEQIKKGVLRAQFLFKSLIQHYIEYKSNEYK